MADDGVSYESLKNRWQREVDTGPQELTRLDPNFYERVESYLDELEEEYQREHEVDPTSGKAMLLQDELFNLRKILEDLYDQRERKVLQLALTAARGGDPDRSNMTAGEKELFESVVAALDEGRRRILKGHDRDLAEDAPKASPVPDEAPDPPEDPLDAYDEDEAPDEEGPAPAPPGDRDGEPGPPGHDDVEGHPRGSSGGADPAEGPETAAVPPEEGLPDETQRPEGAGGTRPDEAGADTAASPGQGDAAAPQAGGDDEDRVVVRVTEAVPAFAASDMRTYDLEAEDVASLPPNAAKTLVEREKAELVEGDLDA
jgi:DNA replication initiation complex subunit (GINS family)